MYYGHWTLAFFCRLTLVDRESVCRPVEHRPAREECHMHFARLLGALDRLRRKGYGRASTCGSEGAIQAPGLASTWSLIQAFAMMGQNTGPYPDTRRAGRWGETFTLCSIRFSPCCAAAGGSPTTR